MECWNKNDINSPLNKKANIIEKIFPIIKNKKFIDNFDSFIFGYLLGNLLKDQDSSIKETLIENLYIEYQKLNKLPFGLIYSNLNNYIITNEFNKMNLNLDIKKEDSDNNFNLFSSNDNINNNNCNIIDINSIDNYNNNNINEINIINKEDNKYKEKKSIIGPEDYEDYNEEIEDEKGKCLICLEEYLIANQDNYYLDCGCIIHNTCFDDYIENAINAGKVPIKCPYCNKEDINELYIKDSLNKNNKINLIEKFEKFNMNYFIMQHPEDISCCPTPGCNYAFIYEEGDDLFECPLCKKDYCLKCKTNWHEGKTCEEYKEMRRMELLGKDDKQLDELFYNFAKGSKFKQCPYCKNWVEKTEGCNHISCRCGNHFCYFCGKGMNGNIFGHDCSSNNYESWHINLRNNNFGLENNNNHVSNNKRKKKNKNDYYEARRKKGKGKK